MAGTGILIAAHGAALVNSMFLPQHAVVIEVRLAGSAGGRSHARTALPPPPHASPPPHPRSHAQIFPWLFKKSTYSNLAALMGLWYLPVYTGRPELNDTSVWAVRMAWQNSTSTNSNFIDGCAGANVSSVSARGGS